MSWKRNPNLVVGLCVALGVTLLIIFTLVWTRGNNETQSPPQRILHPHPQPFREPQRSPPPVPNHETPVQSGKPALVMFYANWCGHSKAILPSWQQMQQTLSQTGQFELIALEQEKYGDEIQKHGIKGFPTIRFYPEGFPSENFIEYKGNRTTDSLIKFVRSGGQEV